MKIFTKNSILSAGLAIASIPMSAFAAELSFDQAAVAAFCAQAGGDANACVSQNSAAYKVVYSKLASETDADVRLVMGGCIQNAMPNWVAVADCVSNPPVARNARIPVAPLDPAAPATSSAPAQAFNPGTLAGQLMATTTGVPTGIAQRLVQMCITQWQGDPLQSKYCVKKEIDGWKALNIN